MKTKFLIFFLSLSMARAAWSAAETPEIIQAPSHSRNSVYQDSSEFYRIDKKYQISAQLLGATVSPVSAGGLNAGMFLDRNSLVQLEYTSGKISWFFFDIEATTFGVKYKHFLGNSFYINTGVDYRRITLSNANWLDLVVQPGELGQAESIAASFAIGNQWQWENFTLGCDWIGLMVPVVALSTRYDSTGLSDTDKRDLDNAWNGVAKATNAMLLRFYLGWSF